MWIGCKCKEILAYSREQENKKYLNVQRTAQENIKNFEIFLDIIIVFDTIFTLTFIC